MPPPSWTAADNMTCIQYTIAAQIECYCDYTEIRINVHCDLYCQPRGYREPVLPTMWLQGVCIASHEATGSLYWAMRQACIDSHVATGNLYWQPCGYREQACIDSHVATGSLYCQPWGYREPVLPAMRLQGACIASHEATGSLYCQPHTCKSIHWLLPNDFQFDINTTGIVWAKYTLFIPEHNMGAKRFVPKLLMLICLINNCSHLLIKFLVQIVCPSC